MMQHLKRDKQGRLRGPDGRVVAEPAIIRFARKCRFDPITGCVLWTGGTQCAQGKTARYGSFSDNGKAVAAHRWSAEHIHGLDITGLQVDHCCPPHPLQPFPNTLCVQHVQAVTQLVNLQLQWGRIRWGWDEPPLPLGPGEPGWPEPTEDQLAAAVPFHEMPAWLRKYQEAVDECPF